PSFLFPAIAVAPFQNFSRCANLLVGRARHAEGAAELVDDALIRRRHRAADRLLPGVSGPLPVGVDIAAGQPRARLVMLLAMRLRRALGVIPQHGGLSRRRSL